MTSLFWPLFALVTSTPTQKDGLIPREVLFGNPQKTNAQISPDGTRLAYLAPDSKNVIQVWVETFDRHDAVVVTKDPRRGVRNYAWAGDGQHILYLQDSDGDENWHVFSVDLKTKITRDLTPFQGVKSQNLLVSNDHPGQILVGIALKNPVLFDMYRIDLATGALTLDTENPGDVLSWTTDGDFKIRAATAFDPKTAATVLRVRDTVDAPWRDLVTWQFEDSPFLGQYNGGTVTSGFSGDGASLYVVSYAHSDKLRMERIDAKTGQTLEVLAEHPNADVAQFLAINPAPVALKNETTGSLEAVAFEYIDLEWKFLDPAMKEDFARFEKLGRGMWLVLNRDREEKRWIVARFVADGPTRYYLYDRPSKRTTFLFADVPGLEHVALAKMKGVVIKARDGLPLVSYVTLPPGLSAKNLPFVIIPHGGPWYRDSMTFDPWVQLLANRGIAVLQVNFRGSTGFGKKFLNAGNHQFGLGMQEDINDAVKWAIKEGIADPKRVGIMGASGGGFATLRGVTEFPDQFACGVDIVGPSDLALLFRTMPPQWTAVKTRWVRRVGDVEHDEALNQKLSPLSRADRIRVPMLIGQGSNDPRVKIENSDKIVNAMRANHVDVTYVVYPDEGHGFVRSENNLDFFGRVEEFFQKCLKSRAEPWKKVEGSTAELH